MVDANWQIVEELSYAASIKELGGARNCDEALAPIMYALHRNPYGFDEVEGIRGGIRIAKTTIKVTASAVLPAMRLWFRVQLSEKTVYLLYVEPCPVDSMPYGDNWLAP